MARQNLGAIVVFGLPASGKGTYSKMISSQYGLPRIVISSLLAGAAKNDKKLAAKIASFSAAGKLVPDSFVFPLLLKRISRADCRKGFVLDGFPRTLSQAQQLERTLSTAGKKISHAVFLSLPVSAAAKRLSDRLSCPKCNLTFSLGDFPPKKPGVCDNCSAPLVRRRDDAPSVVKKRLESEALRLRPLKTFFARKRVLRAFSAKGKRAAVQRNFAGIRRIIG